jgi:hypothetical protein
MGAGDARSNREHNMIGIRVPSVSAILRCGGALLALCAAAVSPAPVTAAVLAPPPPAAQIAVANYFNNTGDNASPNNNILYGVTATPQTGLPPSLVLNLLPINGVNYSQTPPYPGVNYNGLVYAPSTQSGATVDLIAVPYFSSTGSIVRFFGPNFSGTAGPAAPDAVTVWSCSDDPWSTPGAGPCGGPMQPSALALDTNGTLYVLSYDNPNGECGPEIELWAFPASPGSSSGFAANPVLIDGAVAGPAGNDCYPRDYSQNNIDSGLPSETPGVYDVFDLAIAPSGVAAPLTPNDVLVMFSDPAEPNDLVGVTPVALIADYNAANLAEVIKGTAAPPVTPLTVANSSDLTHWGQAYIDGTWSDVVCECENGALDDNAVGFAAWPADSTLMLMTYLGNIFKFTWTTTTGEEGPVYTLMNQPAFWTGLPSGPLDYLSESNGNYQVQNLRTGTLSSQSYAFATAYTQGYGDGPYPTSPSEVLSLDGINTPQSAMESDGPLSALAVSSSPSNSGTGSGCVTGCNLTGGNQQMITGTPQAIAAIEALGANGKVTENVCIVEQDPRHSCNKNAPSSNNPEYNSKTLPVTKVCPNSNFDPSFGNTVIPDYLCGDYGMGGAGTGTGFVVIQGIANGVDSIPGLLVYNDANPDQFFDPGQTEPCTGGEPVTLFGWAPWSGSSVEGSIPESPNMIELTDGCGTSKANSSGLSLNLIGVKLSLTTASEFKPNMVSFAQFKYAGLLVDVTLAPIDIVQKVRLLEIIARSELFLDEGKDACAAKKIWRADQYVADHASHFHGTPGKDPNAYGRSRSRLANLFFTIFSRIEGNPAPQTWPVAQPPGVCVNNLDRDSDGY